MWHVTEGNQAPQQFAAVYFIYLPNSNECLYADDLNTWQAPIVSYGDVQQLATNNPHCPLIPVDPHLALSLGWITVDKMADEMSYITDSLKACLKLIKDIKEEGNGDDTEGLRTSSESASQST